MAERDSTDDPDLKELLDQWTYATDEWREIRKEGAIDMRYVSGDPWDPKDRRAREDAGRPVLSLDEIGQYVNQLINDVRQHKRAINVTPLGSGANDAGAQFLANLIRQIEYRSNAQQVYTTMFENTVQRSYGFARIKAQYVSDRSFEQELVLAAVPNPDLVTPDPDAQSPDGADMKYCYIAEWWPIKDFKRKFKGAKVQDFSKDIPDESSKWIQGERIQLAEYWSIKTVKKTLLALRLPDGRLLHVLDDDPALQQIEAATVEAKRSVDVNTVTQQLTNGLEILEETPWPGQWIPVVSCYGKVLYMSQDGEASTKVMQSLPRLARGPQMLYCYYRTGQAEQVGMATKFPFLAYRGQFAPDQEALIARSLHEPVAVLYAEPVIEQTLNQLLPLPERQTFEPAIQALEMGAEGARRAIQAAMGISPLPTSAQRRNEKSGVALAQMRDAEQQGSFHFIDHYEASITRCGAILEDLIPHYYDTARDVAIRKGDDTTAMVRINDPQQPHEESGQPLMVDRQADYDVTLSTGPSFDSEREAASTFADQLAQNPQVFPLIGDLVVKLKNLGPIGDAMSERLQALLPPGVKPQGKDGQAPIPPEVQQQMAQAQQLIQELTTHVNDLTQQIQTKQVESQAKLQQAEMDNQTKIEIARIQAQTALVSAEIKASSDEMDRRIRQLEVLINVEQETRLDRESRHHDITQQAHEQAHEAGMLAQEHAHSLEQAQHQAALAPAPEQAGA